MYDWATFSFLFTHKWANVKKERLGASKTIVYDVVVVVVDFKIPYFPYI